MSSGSCRAGSASALSPDTGSNPVCAFLPLSAKPDPHGYAGQVCRRCPECSPGAYTGAYTGISPRLATRRLRGMSRTATSEPLKNVLSRNAVLSPRHLHPQTPDCGFGNEPPKAVPGGSTTTASTNGPGRNSSHSTIPTTIDWSRISEEAAWAVTHLALPLTCGFSVREVAGQVGETGHWVTKRMAKLRDELERLNG